MLEVGGGECYESKPLNAAIGLGGPRRKSGFATALTHAPGALTRGLLLTHHRDLEIGTVYQTGLLSVASELTLLRPSSTLFKPQVMQLESDITNPFPLGCCIASLPGLSLTKYHAYRII